VDHSRNHVLVRLRPNRSGFHQASRPGWSFRLPEKVVPATVPPTSPPTSCPAGSPGLFLDRRLASYRREPRQFVAHLQFGRFESGMRIPIAARVICPHGQLRSICSPLSTIFLSYRVRQFTNNRHQSVYWHSRSSKCRPTLSSLLI
jgi:hypothetical protein